MAIMYEKENNIINGFMNSIRETLNVAASLSGDASQRMHVDFGYGMYEEDVDGVKDIKGATINKRSFLNVTLSIGTVSVSKEVYQFAGYRSNREIITNHRAEYDGALVLTKFKIIQKLFCTGTMGEYFEKLNDAKPKPKRKAHSGSNKSH